MHQYPVDSPDLAAGFAAWLCSGKADRARGFHLGATWDVGELAAMEHEILGEDLQVNRLPAKA